MLQRVKNFKQVKGFATNAVLGKPEPQPVGVGTIRKPDFLGGQKWAEKAL